MRTGSGVLVALAALRLVGERGPRDERLALDLLGPFAGRQAIALMLPQGETGPGDQVDRRPRAQRPEDPVVQVAEGLARRTR